MTQGYHTPVLLEESVGLLGVGPAGTYVDLTFGGGGHSRRILSQLGPEGRLYGFDQDRDTLANRPDDARFVYVESNFRFLRAALRLRGVTQVDGILADLGVSSHHFDAVERGFSFRGAAPLDMRMNRRGGRTAADVVNTYDRDALTRVLGDWGELSTPWKVAGCIERPVPRRPSSRPRRWWRPSRRARPGARRRSSSPNSFRPCASRSTARWRRCAWRSSRACGCCARAGGWW